MSLATILLAFDALDRSEQLRLFGTIKKRLFPKPGQGSPEITRLRERRFAEGISCPHCTSREIKRNGLYPDRGRREMARQRYYCKSCRRTFNDCTASPMAGTHYSDKWTTHFKLMVEGRSLRSIAQALGISLSTAFYWRHKVLNALKSLGDGASLGGVVESDETYFHLSFKGQRIDQARRKSRKRGGPASKPGVSREQVAVLAAVDRTGGMSCKIAGRGRLTTVEVSAAIGSVIEPPSILCTDSAHSFAQFAQQKGLEHQRLNPTKGVHVKSGIYHIQHVNSYQSRLKRWMGRFNGVATKYLNNYLYWFRLLEQSKSFDTEVQSEAFIDRVVLGHLKTTVASIRSTPNVVEVGDRLLSLTT